MNNVRKALVLDAEKCNGCRSCELACSTARDGISSPARSRVRVVSFEANDWNCPIVCQQCETPSCAAVCPSKALVKNQDTGTVDFLSERCVGCKMCLIACPFGAISLGTQGKIQKCDLCQGEPTCVDFCRPRALSYGPAEDIGINKRITVAEAVRKAAGREG